jgi:hypothetical protein
MSGSTQLMRIFDAKEEIRYGKVEALDDEEIDKVKSCIEEIQVINKTIWGVIDRYSYPT